MLSNDQDSDVKSFFQSSHLFDSKSASARTKLDADESVHAMSISENGDDHHLSTPTTTTTTTSASTESDASKSATSTSDTTTAIENPAGSIGTCIIYSDDFQHNDARDEEDDEDDEVIDEIKIHQLKIVSLEHESDEALMPTEQTTETAVAATETSNPTSAVVAAESNSSSTSSDLEEKKLLAESNQLTMIASLDSS